MAAISKPLPDTIPTPTRRKYLAAVALHDSRMDGAFVYGVRSTGVYCRPSCPSRRPRAQQILFFVQPEAAEQAGFRACRRCRPRQTQANPQASLVRRVCAEIEASPEGGVSLERLAEVTGLSAAHLQRTFRRAMGITPRQYADALRVARLKSELRKGKDVTTAMHSVSYGSASRLYEKSDAQLGMTPATYRKGGQGMNISYTIAPCALGRVLVAATGRGISAVYMGDRDASSLRLCARNTRTRKSSAIRKSMRSGSRPSCTIWQARIPISICPRTWRPPHFSGASGRNCGRFLRAPPEPIPKWRARSAGPARRAPSLAPALPIPPQSLCLATAWCGGMERSEATAGVWTEKNRCSSESAARQKPLPREARGPNSHGSWDRAKRSKLANPSFDRTASAT